MSTATHEGRCKTPTSRDPAPADLWVDVPDPDCYTRIVRQVRDAPEGVRLSWLIRTATGESPYRSVDGQRRPTAAYQRIRRAVHDLADRGIVRTEKRSTRSNAALWVYPEWIPPLLKNSRQASARPTADPPNNKRAPGSLPRRAPTGRAAEVARSVLRDRCSITTGALGEDVRGALRHALAAHRSGVDTPGMRSDRVSSPSRVARLQATYLSAFEAAAARYRHGTVLTLTARPGESGDMIDSAIAVNESVDPLRDHLRRQTPGPGRPPAIIVREVTGRGVLHLHVALFGVAPAEIDRRALSRYWHETRGHGYIVDLDSIETRACRWVFADHATADTDRGRYVRSYMGEGLHRLREVSVATPDQIHGRADREYWKTTLLWALGLPVVSISQSLRENPASHAVRMARGRGDESISPWIPRRASSAVLRPPWRSTPPRGSTPVKLRDRPPPRGDSSGSPKQ